MEVSHVSTPIIRIPLHSNKWPGLVALVDEADYELIRPYRWYAVRGTHTFYAQRTWFESHPADGRRHGRKHGVYHTEKMHHLLGKPTPGIVVDHVDGNGLNNSRANLRFCTRAQNAHNRQISKGNTSGYTGVSYHQRAGKWQSRINHAGKTQHLGYHATPEAAARAYDAAALRLRGDFAQLNFPDQTNE